MVRSIHLVTIMLATINMVDILNQNPLLLFTQEAPAPQPAQGVGRAAASWPVARRRTEKGCGGASY